MNSLQGTGDTDDDFRFIGVHTEFWRNTYVHSGKLSTYDVPYEKSSVPSKRSVNPSIMEPGNHEMTRITSQRYAVNRYLVKAMEDARNMREESLRGDTLQLAISGAELQNDLKELWRLRNVRELEWSEIVNFLQAALAKEQFEKFTSDTCACVLKVISQYLAGGAVDRDDVRGARQALQKAGLDPWKAISIPAGTSK